MTGPQLRALRPETLPAVAHPPPPAQVAPFVAALGPALAVAFLLRFGGAERPIADRAHLAPRRTPLANRRSRHCLAGMGPRAARGQPASTSTVTAA